MYIKTSKYTIVATRIQNSLKVDDCCDKIQIITNNEKRENLSQRFFRNFDFNSFRMTRKS